MTHTLAPLATPQPNATMPTIEAHKSQERHEAYAAKYRQVQTQLSTLSRQLVQHKAASEAGHNWGFNGDIGYVSHKLAELLEVFNN